MPSSDANHQTRPTNGAHPAPEPATSARDRADRSIGGLAQLLARRPELRGVHAAADSFDDAVRWTA
jgi:hypothetical protein